MTYWVIFVVVFCEWIHWAVWLPLKGTCVSAFFPSIHGTQHPLALLALLKKYSQHKRDCTLLCNQHMYWEQRRESSFKVRPSSLFINDSSWVCCSFVCKDIFFCRNKPSSTVSSWITTSPSLPLPPRYTLNPDILIGRIEICDVKIECYSTKTLQFQALTPTKAATFYKALLLKLTSPPTWFHKIKLIFSPD